MGRVAVFDFDGTMICGDSVVALVRAAYRRRYLSLPALLAAALRGALYRLRLVDAMAAKRSSHAFLSRMTPEARDAFLRGFALELTQRVFPSALACMEAHRRQGDIIVLCSASCQCYMQHVAALLHADALLCTPSAADGACLGPNCRGEEKVRRVWAWLDGQGLSHDALAAAYGDTAGDAPILRASKHPVLVNPKRSLKRLLPQAEQVRWRTSRC